MKLAASNVVVVLMALCLSGFAMAEDALSIMQKSYDAKRVDDQISTLTFRFTSPNKSEKGAVYSMVWKNMHGKKGFDNKAIFFTESPREKKGIAYLGWLRAEGSDKLNDEWIYLPELRMTRRIVQRDHDHSHDDDEFGNSLLTSEHLEPRPPTLDEHSLMEEQVFNDRPHYVISSTPKAMGDMQHQMDGMSHASAKRVNWIDKESLRLDRVQFYNKYSVLELDMEIEWMELEGYWIWQRVEATQPGSNEKTLLEFSDIKINSNLKDRVFKIRSLDKGIKYIR